MTADVSPDKQPRSCEHPDCAGINRPAVGTSPGIGNICAEHLLLCMAAKSPYARFAVPPTAAPHPVRVLCTLTSGCQSPERCMKDGPACARSSTPATPSEVNDALDLAECCVHDKIQDPNEREWVKGVLKKLRTSAPSATLAPDPTQIALNVRHRDCHKAADAFWKYWRENGETHKHGYYESTWGAINRALQLVGVVPHKYFPDAPTDEGERQGVSATYWLIEYREGGQTVGYLKDMRRGDGGFDVLMTRDSAKALRFNHQHSAKNIIDDWAFQRTVPHSDQFFVEGHMDCAGPTHAEIDEKRAEYVGETR